MKKLLFVLCLMFISSTCLATANFTSATGVFLVPNVSVDGTNNYETVTMQLDLASGTFLILDATAKDTSFSETAIDTLTSNGLKVDFFGCAMTGNNQISCKTKVVSTSNDQGIRANTNTLFLVAGRRFSTLFDNQGREYDVMASSFDTTGSIIDINLIQGVPAEVIFIIDEFDIQATSISAFKPLFVDENGQVIEGNFRNIAF